LRCSGLEPPSDETTYNLQPRTYNLELELTVENLSDKLEPCVPPRKSIFGFSFALPWR
jgi:hypothetical protein